MASRHHELHPKPIGNLSFPQPSLGINSAFFAYVLCAFVLKLGLPLIDAF